MQNLSENYRQYQAAKAYSPRPARPGRIDARPRNVVRDPDTGSRLGVTRPDGSMVPVAPEMSRPVRSFMQSRADRVAAAMKDGTFHQKRDAYNRASKNYMDAQGNITERPDPTPKITTSAGGGKKLESPYGTGSATSGPGTQPAMIDGIPAKQWFAERAKAQGQGNLYATADGKLRKPATPNADHFIKQVSGSAMVAANQALINAKASAPGVMLPATGSPGLVPRNPPLRQTPATVAATTTPPPRQPEEGYNPDDPVGNWVRAQRRK